MKLTPEQLKQFDEEGYLFFPNYFSPEETAILKGSIPEVFAQHRPENVRERTGDVVTFKELLEDGRRAMVVGRADEEQVVELGAELIGVTLRAGDSVLLDTRAGMLLEKLQI